jgi:hypothetical protein
VFIIFSPAQDIFKATYEVFLSAFDQIGDHASLVLTHFYADLLIFEKFDVLAIVVDVDICFVAATARIDLEVDTRFFGETERSELHGKRRYRGNHDVIHGPVHERTIEG